MFYPKISHPVILNLFSSKDPVNYSGALIITSSSVTLEPVSSEN